MTPEQKRAADRLLSSESPAAREIALGTMSPDERRKAMEGKPVEVVQPQPGGELFVFARNPAEMVQAQNGMIAWAEKRIEEKQTECDELSLNLTLAEEAGWDVKGLRTAVRKAQRKVQFFEKVRDALKAGYFIVPDMDIDVFAVRTTKALPRANESTSKHYTPSVALQQPNLSAAGEGRYVSPNASLRESKSTEVNEKGITITTTTRWAEEFKDVDFPFKLAKPEVLAATAAAIRSKIFDEVGILPRRRGADPMVIGRVTYREGYQRKSVNFLVAWFIDTKDI